MMDSFVLLAPIFLLGLIALLGFVGCFTKPSPPVPPKLTSISPTTGSTAGGTPVVLTGTNIGGGLSVFFGSSDPSEAQLDFADSNLPTSLAVVTGPHTAGFVDVAMYQYGVEAAILSYGYRYTDVEFEQVSAATPQVSVQSVSVSFPGFQVSGNLNVVVVGWNDNVAAVQMVNDNNGNVYAPANTPTAGTGIQQVIYVATNINAGSCTVTVQFTQPAKNPDVRILEYSGLDLKTPVDATAAAAGTGTVADTGFALTNSDQELVFAAGTTTGSFNAPGAGYTSRIITTPDADIAEDQVVSHIGSFNATATLNISGSWVIQLVTFRRQP